MEGLCIVRTEEEAREIKRHFRGGNAQSFPVASKIEESLPDRIVQFGKRLPNDLDGERFYAKHKLKLSVVPTGKFDELGKRTRELREIL
jgi:hypothetical protein